MYQFFFIVFLLLLIFHIYLAFASFFYLTNYSYLIQMCVDGSTFIPPYRGVRKPGTTVQGLVDVFGLRP